MSRYSEDEKRRAEMKYWHKILQSKIGKKKWRSQHQDSKFMPTPSFWTKIVAIRRTFARLMVEQILFKEFLTKSIATVGKTF